MEKNVEYKEYKRYFSIRSNDPDGPKVQKTDPKYGNGDINSGANNGVIVYYDIDTIIESSLTFIPEEDVVRLYLKYTVENWDYKIDDSADSLYMEHTIDWDVSDFTYLEISRDVVEDDLKTTTRTSRLLLPEMDVEPTSIKYSAKVGGGGQETHEMVTPAEWDYNGNYQSWFPTDGIQVRVDGKGKEVDEIGNMMIEGYVSFRIERTDEIETKSLRGESSPETENVIDKTKGSEQTIEMNERARNVIGCGYDITGDYASPTFCKGRVFDVDELNKYGRIRYDDSKIFNTNTSSGNSKAEFSKDVTKTIKVNVSAKAYGALFTHEIDKTFTKNEKKVVETSYKMENHRRIYSSYDVVGYANIPELIPFLSETFKNALKTYSADALIDEYGTHVVLGARMGGRKIYSERTQSNYFSESKTSNVTNKTSISFGSDGLPKSKEEGLDLNELEADMQKVLDSDSISLADKLKQLAEYNKSVKGTKDDSSDASKDKKGSGNNNGGGSNSGGSNSGGSNSGGGNSSGSNNGTTPSNNSGYGGGLEYTKTNITSETFTTNNSTTEICAYGVGGDPSKLENITDHAVYTAWEDTVKADQVFMDYVEGTLIPIEDIVEAVVGYQEDHPEENINKRRPDLQKPSDVLKPSYVLKPSDVLKPSGFQIPSDFQIPIGIGKQRPDVLKPSDVQKPSDVHRPGSRRPVVDRIPDTGSESQETQASNGKYMLTKEAVAIASENYMLRQEINEGKLYPATVTKEFNTVSKENTENINSNADEEVSSKKNKKTGWKVHIELLNVEDTRQVSWTVCTQIHEGGLSMNQTTLQNTYHFEVDKGNDVAHVVDRKLNPTFDTSGEFVGEYHDWINVTDKFNGCEFLDLEQGVYIKIDGKGSDSGNVGLKGKLKIPYLRLKR